MNLYKKYFFSLFLSSKAFTLSEATLVVVSKKKLNLTYGFDSDEKEKHSTKKNNNKTEKK